MPDEPSGVAAVLLCITFALVTVMSATYGLSWAILRIFS